MFFLFVCVGVLIFEEHALSTMAVLRPVVELDLASRTCVKIEDLVFEGKRSLERSRKLHSEPLSLM